MEEVTKELLKLQRFDNKGEFVPAEEGNTESAKMDILNIEKILEKGDKDPVLKLEFKQDYPPLFLFFSTDFDLQNFLNKLTHCMCKSNQS